MDIYFPAGIRGCFAKVVLAVIGNATASGKRPYSHLVYISRIAERMDEKRVCRNNDDSSQFITHIDVNGRTSESFRGIVWLENLFFSFPYDLRNGKGAY